MIIRAVNSDEDDDDNEQQQVGGSVFDSEGTGSAGTEGSLHSAKFVWIATTLALAVLVLVDIAGILNQFQQQQQPIGAENESARDAFALTPILIAWWGRSGSVLASLYAAPATSANSVVGSLIVAGWIYSREQSKNVRRHRAKQRRGSGGSGPNANYWTAGWSWLPIAGLICFGHVVSCMYILMALFESNGDRRVFFLGKSSSSRTRPGV